MKAVPPVPRFENSLVEDKLAVAAAALMSRSCAARLLQPLSISRGRLGSECFNATIHHSTTDDQLDLLVLLSVVFVVFALVPLHVLWTVLLRRSLPDTALANKFL